MRELAPSLPEGAAIVLERQKYWDPGFVGLFFEYTEDLIFHEPQAGLQVADVARRLAHATFDGDDPESLRHNRERLIRGYGLLGSARRATGQLESADSAYQEAVDLCGRRVFPHAVSSEKVSPPCRGELCLRLAFLRAFQKRFAEALKLVDQALELFDPERDEEWLGRAFATQGAVLLYADRFSEAVSVLGRTLGNYKLSPRVESSAAANLAHAVSEADDPRGLEAAQSQLRRARQLAGPRRSVQKSIFYWIEGRIYVRRGSTERAERCYRKALQGFFKFKTPYEIALVGLDLSSLFRFSKRWAELEELTADIYQRFRDLQEDAEALAALKMWLEGAQARDLTIDAISRLKITLSERMRTQPPA